MPVVVKLMRESRFSDIDCRMQVIFVAAKIVGWGGCCGGIGMCLCIIEVPFAGKLVIYHLQLSIDGGFGSKSVINASPQPIVIILSDSRTIGQGGGGFVPNNSRLPLFEIALTDGIVPVPGKVPL